MINAAQRRAGGVHTGNFWRSSGTRVVEAERVANLGVSHLPDEADIVEVKQADAATKPIS
jgi:hypothetical protein